MGRYGVVFEFLGAQPGFVATTVLNAVVAALFLGLVGTWLPLLVLRRSGADADRESPDTLPGASRDGLQGNGLSVMEMLALAVGGGLMLSVALGTASAYLFKQLTPGLTLTVVIGVLTTLLLAARLRGNRIGLGVGLWTLVGITTVPLCLGLWQHVFMAFPYDLPGGRMIVFADMHRDSGFHVYLASILRETGLPLIDLHGSPAHEFAPVTHTGHAVLMGMLATVLRTSLYGASTALWIVSMVLMVWSAAVLLLRAGVPTAFVWLGSLALLVIGPVTTPPMALLTQPELAVRQSPLVSARMYWNLPQALSIAMVAVALICFDRYCRAQAGSRDRLNAILVTAAAIVASGWVKPSLFVFYGPALVITLLVHRASLRELATVVLTFVGGVAVYLLPALLVTVPGQPSWSVHPSFEQTQAVIEFLLLGSGPMLLLALNPLRNLAGSVVRKSDPKPLTLALVAMGGSLLFALLFREDRFAALVDFPVLQPNIWWGPSACVVLLFPLLLRSAVQRIIAVGKADWFVMSGFILVSLQVVSGTLFAVAYPAIIGRVHPQLDVDILVTVREKTSPRTRLLLDPILLHEQVGFTDIAGILARPCLFATNYMSDGDREVLESWHRLFGEKPEVTKGGWAEYDAAIISEGAQSEAAREAVSDLGWKSEELTHAFQLWRRPESASE